MNGGSRLRVAIFQYYHKKEKDKYYLFNEYPYIVFSAIAKNYFKKSSNWILQRLHGYEVNGKPAQFKPGEITIFVKALRDIAAKLNEAADRIEQAKETEEE